MNFPNYEQQTNATIAVITICTLVVAIMFIWSMATP